MKRSIDKNKLLLVMFRTFLIYMAIVAAFILLWWLMYYIFTMFVQQVPFTTYLQNQNVRSDIYVLSCFSSFMLAPFLTGRIIAMMRSCKSFSAGN